RRHTIFSRDWSSDVCSSDLPEGYEIPETASYFHYTTNNTVEGTQMHAIPQTTVPLVADMSSDIMSREMDFTRFALIYAGAQKNEIGRASCRERVEVWVSEGT